MDVQLMNIEAQHLTIMECVIAELLDVAEEVRWRWRGRYRCTNSRHAQLDRTRNKRATLRKVQMEFRAATGMIQEAHERYGILQGYPVLQVPYDTLLLVHS